MLNLPLLMLMMSISSSTLHWNDEILYLSMSKVHSMVGGFGDLEKKLRSSKIGASSRLKFGYNIV